MAEYAGLEIRIGGNTTKLTNALKASTKSAAELQRSLRQITKAMQFDPHNLKNVETRIKITGDRMQSLQSKVQITKEAMRQLGDTMTSVLDKNGNAMSVKRVAEETQDLSLAAKQADERYVKFGKTLAQIYDAWNGLAREKGADFLRDKMGFTQAEAEQLMKSSKTLRDFIDNLREVQTERASITYSGNKPLISDADIERAKEFKELDFHGMFKRGLDLDDVLKQAEQFGITIEDSAVATVRELQKTFKDAQADKKGFDEALQWQQMGEDVQRFESEVESLSQTMRKLDDGMTQVGKTEYFQYTEERIRGIDAAIDNLDGDLKRTGEAMKLDPSNMQLATRYFSDLQQKVALSQEKAQLLRQEMKQLKLTGADKAAKDHQDLAKWIEESAEAARKAHKEYTDQSAAVANLEDQIKGLKQAIKMVEGDELLAGYSEAVLQWKKRTQELETEMGELAKAEKLVADTQKKLGEDQTAFDAAQKDAEQYKQQLEELKAEFQRLSATLSDPNLSDDVKFANYTRLGELETEIQQVGAAYSKAEDKASKLSDALEDQKERAKIAQSALEQQRGTVDDLQAAVNKLEKTPEVKLFKNPTGEIDDAKEALEKMEGELDEAKVKEKQLSDAYDSARTENELAKTAKHIQDVGAKANDTEADIKGMMKELDVKRVGILNASTVKSLGMTLSATLTPMLTGLGYSMIDASSDVDAAYRDMRKTVEGTEAQFEHLRSAAIDFSRTHVTSADQILQIEAIGGELGIATENLETFAEVISNLDVATNLDTEGAATALGHLSNVLKLNEDDYVGFSDALVRLGNNGASTETEIANIAERIGSMGSIVGMSGSDILAWSSTIASTGQRAEAAGTAISKTMSYMETAVAAAGGTMDTSFNAIKAAVEEGGDKLTVFANLTGKTAEEFTEEWENAPKDMASTVHDAVESAKGDLQLIADVAHMSASDFAETWENDPTEALKSFIEGLNDIEESGGSADKVLQNLDITSVRQKQAIEGLMQTIGGLNDNLEMSEHAWNGVSDQWGKAGDAANEAQKKAEGFSGQVQILKNMWQNFLSELGEGATPWVKMLSGSLQDVSQWFSTLSADTKKWLVALGGVGVAIGPLLSMGATFATSAGEIKKWADTALGASALVKIAMKHNIEESVVSTMTKMDKLKLVGMDLGTTLLKGLAVSAVVAGVAAIGYCLYQLYKRYQDHIAATEGLTDAISGIGRVSNVAADGIDNTKRSVGDLITVAGGAEGRLADLAKSLEDSNRQYDTYAGPLENYARTVETLAGKAERSKDETNKLAAALQGVNDACGTTYGLDEYGNIIDTETGKIQKNTDVIRANIELRKQQALIDYYSDDYAKAIGQQEDARQTVYDLAEEYRNLRTEAGKQAWIDNYVEVTGNAADAEQAFNGHLQRTKNALEESKNEFDRTSEVVNNLDGRIADATEKMNESKKAIDDAAAAQAEYDRRTETVTSDVSGNMKRLSDTMEKMGESDASFNAITDSMEAISVSAKEMDDVDMTKLVAAFSDAGSSMSDVIATLEEGGVHMDTWNAALEAAPDAAEKMGSVTSAAFQSMYDVAGSSLEDTITLIEGLDSVEVGDKTFYVTDNGSIFDEQGQVYNIKTDIAEIPDEVITAYYVDDKDALKKAQDAKKKADDYGKKKATAKLDAKDNASKKVDSAQDKLGKLNSTTATPTVNVTDYASDKLDAINRKIDSTNGRSATFTIYEKTVKSGKQATGGMNNRPVIPEHASGYIATGPTLTNQGWIGEDGIEAVANWATGGAVVPLTNRRYMLPIADAIADGMARRMGDGGGNNNITVYVSGVASPNEVADAITRKLTLLGF